MKLTISPSTKKQVAHNRALLNVSEEQYVHNALAHYDQLLTLNIQLQEELSLWEVASASDFDTWARKHHA